MMPSEHFLEVSEIKQLYMEGLIMRMGYARFEAILEDLRRSLNLTGSTIAGANVQLADDAVIEADAASVLLTAAQTGAMVHLHRSAGSEVTLPSNATVGMRYTFAVRTLLGSNNYKIVTGSGNTFSTSGLVVQRDDTDAATAHAIVRPSASNTVATMTYHVSNKTALLGTVLEVECVAAGKWRISGTHCVDGSGAIVFSDS
jgi:hypothetical protein